MQLFLSGQFLQSSELLINKSGFTIACKLHSYLFIVAYLVSRVIIQSRKNITKKLRELDAVIYTRVSSQ